MLSIDARAAFDDQGDGTVAEIFNEEGVVYAPSYVAYEFEEVLGLLEQVDERMDVFPDGTPARVFIYSAE